MIFTVLEEKNHGPLQREHCHLLSSWYHRAEVSEEKQGRGVSPREPPVRVRLGTCCVTPVMQFKN